MKGPQTLLDLVRIFYTQEFAQMFPGVAIVESHLIKLENEGKISRDGIYISISK